jgi:hypothetical protein
LEILAQAHADALEEAEKTLADFYAATPRDMPHYATGESGLVDYIENLTAVVKAYRQATPKAFGEGAVIQPTAIVKAVAALPGKKQLEETFFVPFALYVDPQQLARRYMFPLKLDYTDRLVGLKAGDSFTAVWGPMEDIRDILYRIISVE